MENTIAQIFDKMLKKILTLSVKAVINLINGLFGTNYATDSKITYQWTETIGDDLGRILADTIITINDKFSYHIEAQMTKDDDIVFRAFGYGYGHAEKYKTTDDDSCTLFFPEVRILYLCQAANLPDEYKLKLDFGTQGTFLYKAPTVKLQSFSTEELNRKKMVILIPFFLLKLRENINKERSKENLEALKSLINNDIIGSIEDNLAVGNITQNDARYLLDLTRKLYNHIYSHYMEMAVEGINDMTDQSLILDFDIILMEHEKELKQMEAEITQAKAEITQAKDEIAQAKDEITQRDTEIAQRDTEIAQKDSEITHWKSQLSEKEMEIARLQKLLAEKN